MKTILLLSSLILTIAFATCGPDYGKSLKLVRYGDEITLTNLSNSSLSYIACGESLSDSLLENLTGATTLESEREVSFPVDDIPKTNADTSFALHWWLGTDTGIRTIVLPLRSGSYIRYGD